MVQHLLQHPRQGQLYIIREELPAIDKTGDQKRNNNN